MPVTIRQILMTNSPKWKKCRDCGHEPEYKTTTMTCGRCKGLLRVKRRS